MDRHKELDAFFDNLKNIIQYNNGQIDEHCIYNMLMRYDFGYDEFLSGKNLDYLFVKWEDYYRNKKNISVYNSPSQARFLQFVNSNSSGAEYVKLYVSLKLDYMEDGVKRIFDFLEKNNIEHHSKVSDCIRSDSIVLRIKKSEDAKKVVDFINSDSYLVEGAKRTNPFLFRNGIVGAAYDNKLSYNSTISFLIDKYVNYCICNSNFESISFNGFSLFVHKYIDIIFSNRNALEDFLKSSYCKDNYDRIKNNYTTENSLEYFLVNVKSVMELIDYNLKCKDDFSHFMSLYDNSVNSETKKSMCIGFLDLLNINADEYFDEPKELLDEFIIYLYSESKNIDDVLFAINGFAFKNNAYITRRNNYRKRFINYLNKDTILNITSGNIDLYIYKKIESLDGKTFIDYLVDACNLTLNKYVLSSFLWQLVVGYMEIICGLLMIITLGIIYIVLFLLIYLRKVYFS